MRHPNDIIVNEITQSEKIAGDLYKRILDAGLQFQLLEVSVPLRRGLFELSEEVSLLMVRHDENFDDEAKLAKMLEAFDAFCALVPGYEKSGMQNFSAKNGLAQLRQELSSKKALIEILQEDHNQKKIALSAALSRLKMIDLYVDQIDHQRELERKEVRHQFSLAQNQLNEIDRKIKSVTFFGADTIEPL